MFDPLRMERNLTPVEDTTDSAVYVVTEEELVKLQSELEQLRREKDGDVAQELREAREFGSPAANDELWAIREAEAVLDARIARLEEVVSAAQVVDGNRTSGGVARIGSIIEVEDVPARVTRRYRMVGVLDSSADGAIPSVSAASPVGRAIMGHREGTHVSVDLPRGGQRQLRLVRVERPSLNQGRRAAS